MILLILGWHLALIGFIAIILGSMIGSVPCVIFGVGTLIPGLIMSVILRKTCSNYRSDTADKPIAKAPLDYY